MSRAYLRLPVLASVVIILLLGMWAGLIRMGWALPLPTVGAVAAHGPLMVGGVMGTLICLERAVALAGRSRRGGWGYIVPILTASGGVLLALDTSQALPHLLITAGSAGLIMMFMLILQRHSATYTVVMTIGAVCWFIGNLLWASGQPVFQVVHWWIGFLVLTVVGERLELSQVIHITVRQQRYFLAAVVVYLVGITLTIPQFDAGIRLAGIGDVLLAAWLLHYDIARRTVRRAGLPRYIAVSLLTGYVWLAVGGGFGVIFGAVRAGAQYEMLLHAVLLGFIFSMIFGHALIIIPAMTGRTLKYRSLFYLPLLVLHISLVLRMLGDVGGNLSLRQWGGMLNVTAILLFMSLIVWTVIRDLAPKQMADAKRV